MFCIATMWCEPYLIEASIAVSDSRRINLKIVWCCWVWPSWCQYPVLNKPYSKSAHPDATPRAQLILIVSHCSEQSHERTLLIKVRWTYSSQGLGPVRWQGSSQRKNPTTRPISFQAGEKNRDYKVQTCSMKGAKVLNTAGQKKQAHTNKNLNEGARLLVTSILA